jgi:hypothetical protein
MLKDDPDSLTEDECFSQEDSQSRFFQTNSDTEREKTETKRLIDRNNLPEYNFFYRKKKNFEKGTKLSKVTKEVMEWPYEGSDTEIEEELKLKCDLNFSKKASEAYENWKAKKSLFEQIRPPKFKEIFPVNREKKLVQPSPFCDFKEVVVYRPRSNKEIFEDLPEFFKVNPFFVDLDERFKTNWFNLQEETENLLDKAKIEFSDLATKIAGTVNVKAFDRNRKSIAKTGAFVIESDEEVHVIDESYEYKATASKKSKEFTERKEDQAVEMSAVEGNPDTDAGIEVHSVLSKKMKQEILKKATMYRQEFSLKSIKTYFFMWKRKVEKLNEKKIQKMKKKEHKREKKMIEKSLIQREAVTVVEKDKAPSKELYYQKDEIDIKLRHELPGKISKFIRNCNNIYHVSDGSHEPKKYKRKKKKDRKIKPNIEAEEDSKV